MQAQQILVKLSAQWAIHALPQWNPPTAAVKGRLALRAARRFAPLATTASFLLLLFSGSLFLLATQLTGLLQLDDIGYGDSYILYDVQHFQRTGEVYRDLSQPPYLPAQYSPLVYMMYALPRLNVFGIRSSDRVSSR